MKINELLNEEEQLDEIEPGVVPGRLNIKRYFGQGKRNAQMIKQDKQTAKQLYAQWNNYAVRINQALANDPELQKKSADYFISFISKVLRIPATNPMFDEIENMLGGPTGMNYNKETAQKALDYAVAQRSMAMLGPSGRGSRGGSGGPPSVPDGSQVNYVGKRYTYTNGKWIGGATGTEVLTGTDASAATQQWADANT